MSLLDQLNEDDSFAKAWIPKEHGPVIHGKIVGFGRRSTEYQPEGYMILTIQPPEGERLAVHAFHYVLAEELKKYKLRNGTEIAIKYLGKPEGKNYEAYKVVADAEVNQGEGDPQYVPPTDVPAAAPVSGPVPTGADDDIPF